MKLCVFCKSIWNGLNDSKNFYEAYKRVPETDAQKSIYIKGVGTRNRSFEEAYDCRQAA